jgi:glycosyltransferase involved in cell wall biosynthesis
MIRIAHLSVGEGGASQAAQLLNQSLSECGINSSMLPTNMVDTSYLSRIKSKKTTMLNMVDAKSEYEFLSSKSTERILNLEKIKNTYHLLHIHNWYNLLSPRQLSTLSRLMPVVITAHDERIMTGGCHTTLGCTKYFDGCFECPASRFLKKSVQASFKDTNNIDYERLGVITPSMWLREKFESKLLRNNTISDYLVNIPNLIDPVFFKNYKVQDDKRSSDNFNIIFVAANNRTKIKNLKVLVEAHHLLRQKSPLYRKKAKLHLVGARGEDYKDVSVIPHGFLNKVELQELMIRMDLCCVPSLADNFPSVIAESQLSNVYVLGSNVGGIPEMLSNGSMGDLVNPTTQAITDSIEKFFIESKFETLNPLNEIRIKANQKYDSQEIITKHSMFYVKVINSWKYQE